MSNTQTTAPTTIRDTNSTVEPRAHYMTALKEASHAYNTLNRSKRHNKSGFTKESAVDLAAKRKRLVGLRSMLSAANFGVSLPEYAETTVDEIGSAISRNFIKSRSKSQAESEKEPAATEPSAITEICAAGDTVNTIVSAFNKFAPGTEWSKDSQDCLFNALSDSSLKKDCTTGYIAGAPVAWTRVLLNNSAKFRRPVSDDTQASVSSI